MAMLQLKCPETGKPVDLHDVPAEEALLPIGGAAKVWRIPCPHCGGSHTWTSSGFAMAMGALRSVTKDDLAPGTGDADSM